MKVKKRMKIMKKRSQKKSMKMKRKREREKNKFQILKKLLKMTNFVLIMDHKLEKMYQQ